MANYDADEDERTSCDKTSPRLQVDVLNKPLNLLPVASGTIPKVMNPVSLRQRFQRLRERLRIK